MTQSPTSSQSAVDEVVSAWPDVRVKGVFGHRGYIRNGKMFAFLAVEGVAVKTLSDEEAASFYARDGVAPFVYDDHMEMKAWPVLPLRADADLDEALTAVRGAYESAG